MEWLHYLLNNTTAPTAIAFLLGLLTALSPCPLATNIAAIGYIGKHIESHKEVFKRGILYTLGRMITYIARCNPHCHHTKRHKHNLRSRANVGRLKRLRSLSDCLLSLVSRGGLYEAYCSISSSASALEQQCTAMYPKDSLSNTFRQKIGGVCH